MRKFAMETTVGIFVLLGLVLIGYMTIKLGHVTFFGDDSYSLYAKFTSVSGLRAGNPVKMLGMEIGRVEALTIDQDDLKAVVEIRIKNGIKVYDDAIASIKTEGLIGDRYLSIDPGGRNASCRRCDHHRNPTRDRNIRPDRQIRFWRRSEKR